MEQITHTDEKGRKYQAYSSPTGVIIIGPPEGLVDQMGLPEPFATKLHNILFDRGLFNYESVSRQPNILIGALQEALTIDTQRLLEFYFKYEKPGGSHE